MFRPELSALSGSAWKSLRTLCTVRVLIAAAVVFAMITGGPVFQAVPLRVALVYFAMALLGLLVTWAYTRHYVEQLALSISTDLVAIAAMVALAPTGEGVSLLFFFPVAGAALLTELPMALFVAAVASLIVLVDAAMRQLGGAEVSYTQTGALGATMFAVAWLLNRLAERVIAQERLVSMKNAELQAQVRVNRAVINEMRQGILLVSQDGHVRAANPAARSVLDLDRPELTGDLGERIAQHYPTLNRVLSAWAHVRPTDTRAWTVALESAAGGEGDGQGPARPPRRVRIRSVPFGVEKPHDAPLLVSIEDMREVETQAMQLKLASMGRLTASIAHEIRNPLAAISHAADLLAEDAPDDSSRRLLRIVHDNVHRLDRIVGDILSVSRATRVRMEHVPLTQAITQMVTDFARDREIDLQRFAIDIDDGLVVRFDRAHLTQIVVNLVANGARYGSATAGAVEITADREPSGGVRLTVANDGPPIGEDVRGQLFEPFFTTDRHGTGLGLFLARELAIANAAELFLDEAAAQSRHLGAAFTLRFAPSHALTDTDASVSEP